MPFRGMDDNATHLPILAAALANSEGPVVEFGPGHYSTLLIKALCPGRPVLCLEHNPWDGRAWFDHFAAFAGDGMSIRYVDGWNGAETKIPDRIGVALVDAQPPDSRAALARLVTHARYVILHDSEDGQYGYESVYPFYRYRRDYRRYRPWTTVVSNQADIDLCPWME